jgi:hypothetical protein
LIQKTDRQPKASTSPPPRTGPIASASPGPLGGSGECVRDDRHARRVEHRAADGLQRARRDQPPDARRQSAQQRTESEGREAGLEDAPSADPVGG